MIRHSIYLLTFAYFAPLLLSTLQINMEPTNLGYSTKNIPFVQPKEYLKYLFEKTESFLRRIRWKTYHFLKSTQSEPAKETFVFNTTKSLPTNELEAFEGKMLSLIQNVQFKNHHKLSQEKLLVAADKTTNFYRLDGPTYDKLIDT